MLHIGADQLRGAGEVLVDLFAEELSQQRQRPVAHPGAKQRLVSVHGVVPPRQVVQAADLLGVDVAKGGALVPAGDRKSTRLNSSHVAISYAVFCLKKKMDIEMHTSSREQIWKQRTRPLKEQTNHLCTHYHKKIPMHT